MYWTHYSEDKILRTFLGTTVSAPSKLYVACMLSNPGNAGTGTEISYSGYSRQELVFSAPADDSTGKTITNVSDVSFPDSPSAAGTITHCALFDSLIGGNMWGYMILDEPIEVSAGVAPLIQAGEWNYVSQGNFSKAFKGACLNLLRGTDLTGFTPYIALYNGSPDDGGAELTGGGYARFSIDFQEPAIQPSGQTTIKNNTAASTGRATENWGTWTHTAITNAASGGQVIAYVQRDPSIIMGRGKAAFIRAEDLSISLT